MFKLKIIDLLNKIANGEVLPKRIFFWGKPYYYDEECDCYMYQCDNNGFIDLLDNYDGELRLFLNDEVEIIESDLKL